MEQEMSWASIGVLRRVTEGTYGYHMTLIGSSSEGRQKPLSHTLNLINLKTLIPEP